jgi:hypothetical protein
MPSPLLYAAIIPPNPSNSKLTHYRFSLLFDSIPLVRGITSVTISVIAVVGGDVEVI